MTAQGAFKADKYPYRATNAGVQQCPDLVTEDALVADEQVVIEPALTSLLPINPHVCFSALIEKQIAAATTVGQRERWRMKLADFRTPRRPWELATTTTRLGPAARPSYARDQCEALP